MMRGVVRDASGVVPMYRSVILDVDELGALDLVGPPCRCPAGRDGTTMAALVGHWNVSPAWACAETREAAAVEDAASWGPPDIGRPSPVRDCPNVPFLLRCNDDRCAQECRKVHPAARQGVTRG